MEFAGKRDSSYMPDRIHMQDYGRGSLLKRQTARPRILAVLQWQALVSEPRCTQPTRPFARIISKVTVIPVSLRSKKPPLVYCMQKCQISGGPGRRHGASRTTLSIAHMSKKVQDA